MNCLNPNVLKNHSKTVAKIDKFTTRLLVSEQKVVLQPNETEYF